MTVAGQGNDDIPSRTLNSMLKQAGLKRGIRNEVYGDLRKIGHGIWRVCARSAGLGVVGKTLDDTEKLIREGIEAHLTVMREHGEVIPEPTSTAGFVEIPFSA